MQISIQLLLSIFMNKRKHKSLPCYIIMAKSVIQFLLQKILGYHNYLFFFALYSIYKFRFIKRDKEFDFFLKLIAKQNNGSIIIDIGANIGVTAVLLAMRFPLYQIKALEPVQMHISVMKRVVKYFGVNNIQMYQVAIGNMQQMVTISTPIKNGVIKHGWSFINGEVHVPEFDKLELLTEDVFMNTLDAISESWQPSNIAAIKIDVENYELFVLDGAKNLLQQSNPLIFAELWINHRREAVLELMNGFEYQAMVYSKTALKPYKGNNALNFFFVPHEVSLRSNKANEH